MLPIEYIRIRNSFKYKDLTITFQEGLNYIVGPNGAGKSIILEMIGFAFFGSASLRDVTSNYKKLEVEMVFNFNGITFKIVRTTTNAFIYMKEGDEFNEEPIVVSTSEVNNKIIALLGYDYSIYELSNYCKQGELQYISKMTPANRVKFIDKISGIEDAKELMSWLDAKRKLLVSEVNTLSKICVKPEELQDPTILEIDFDSKIEESNLDILRLTNIEKQIVILETKIQSVVKPPIISNSYKSHYGDMSEEKFQEYLAKYQEITSLETEIDELIAETALYKTTNEKFKDFTESDYDTAIFINKNNHDYEVKLMLLHNSETICPSCSFGFSTNHEALSEYKNVNQQYTPLFSKEDCVLFRQYLDETKYLIEEIDSRLIAARKDYIGLTKSVPSFILDNTKKEFINSYNLHQNFKKDFEIKMNEYMSEVLLISHYKNELEELRVQTKDVNLTQLFKDKEELTQQKHIKNSFLEKFIVYEKHKELLSKSQKQLETVVALIKKAKESAALIKKEAIPLINHHSSKLLNTLTNGEMLKIDIKDNYDIVVDNYNIKVKSGSEQDVASLAFRLSLGHSVIPSMLPLIIGDEIDASSSDERSEYITEALKTMSHKGYQLILVTHKSLENIDYGNIIDLGVM